MTLKQVDIHPDALGEAEAALTWYGERSSRAPGAFIEELDKAIQSILDAPKRWPIFESDCRRVPLFRFPYSIVYREKSNDLSRSSQSLMVGEGQVIGERGVVRPFNHPGLRAQSGH